MTEEGLPAEFVPSPREQHRTRLGCADSLSTSRPLTRSLNSGGMHHHTGWQHRGAKKGVLWFGYEV